MRAKILAVTVSLVLGLSLALSGCAPRGSGGSTVPVNVATDSTPYRQEKIQLPEDATSVLAMQFAEEGRLLIAATDQQRSRVVVFEEEEDGTLHGRFNTDDLAASQGKEMYVMTAGFTLSNDLLVNIHLLEDETSATYQLSADGFTEVLTGFTDDVLRLQPFDENTVLVGSSVIAGESELRRVDLATGETICTFDLLADHFIADVAVWDNKVIVTTSHNSASTTKNYIDAYDAQTGKRTDLSSGLRAALENAIVSKGETGEPASPNLATTPDGVYVCMPGGISRCTDEGITRMLAEGDSHLAVEAYMPGHLLVHPEAGFVVQYTDRSARSFNSLLYHYREGAPIEPTETLKLYMLEDDPDVQQAVATFRDARPDVKVEVQVGLTSDTSLTVDDAVRALNADILAGTGPDVLVLDGLPMDDLTEQGLLLDLSDQLETLRTSGDYYDQVLSAFTTDEGCFAMPTRFIIPAMMGEPSILAKVTSLEALAAYFETSESSQAQLATVCIAPLYLADLPNIVPNEATVDEAALSSYFDAMKRLLVIDEAHSMAAEYGYDYWELAFEQGGTRLASMGNVSSLFLPDPDAPTERFATGLLQQATDFGSSRVSEQNAGFPCVMELLKFGEHQVFEPSSVVGVSAGSPAADTAKDFIAHLLSLEQQAHSQGFSMPVSRVAVDDVLHLDGTGIGFMTDEGMIDYSADAFTDEERAAIHRMIETATYACMPDKVVEDALLDSLRAYCLDEMTLEEAVATAQQKINLYHAQ